MFESLTPGDQTPEQRQLSDAFRDFFRSNCSPKQVRASEALGFDEVLWGKIVDMGALQIALPITVGGDGGTLADLAVVVEEAGRVLAPVPLVDVAVARRLAARHVAPPVPPGEVTVIDFGGAAAGSRLHPVGALATSVVSRDAGDLLLCAAACARSHPGNLANLPIGELTVGTKLCRLASGATADASWDLALAEWRALSACSAAGLAAAALAMAVDYARRRTAFGRHIGSFQALAHRLADISVLVDATQLLSWRAVTALDQGSPESHSLAAMAWHLAARSARDAAEYALHVHGGGGYAMEYDIQLFFRRAEVLPALLPPDLRGLGAVADVMFGPRRPI
jgi:alkylation response protein AidB-like acyl-CoA dehydrogenase